MTWIVLLRGINVGGNRKVPMKDLKAALEATGITGVKTYIQSGNVVLQSDLQRPDLLDSIQQLLVIRFGFVVTVVLRTAQEWQQVIAQNPFPDQTDHLHVAFLGGVPEERNLATLKELEVGSDRWELQGENIYLQYPEGTANAKLTHVLLEKKLKVSATVRNWRTVLAVGQMLDA
ncbi:DUF1697 domain-containing protein [Deinococcus roseus]|uniref:DUF1697 domain-containing protein n=1 Tax=Deinococcus roseus TaxID=392414 RepID=A0ABQ2DCK9_9DEIO|nr:DUF1697 domain-containing protein [Deinococcus roseus]GGJ51368.1 hypothetical protein GCM10008938_41700 [Deinococcus roseus]